MIDQCQTIKMAWSRIESWAQRQTTTSSSSIDDQIIERLGSSVQTGNIIISALEEDILQVLGETLATVGFRRRNKIVWNEQVFRDHQDRIRGQLGAMTLLVEVTKL